MKRKLLLIGGGGHCKSIIDSLDSYTIYEEISIIDKSVLTGTMVGNRKVIGTDDDLVRLKSSGYTDGFVSVGSIGNPSIRIKLTKRIRKLGFHIPNIVDSSSHVSPSCKLGEGIYIGKAANINAGCFIGDGAIINTGAIVEHECKVGPFVHIAPGAVVCGNTTIGENTHIGANATVLQGVRVGDNVMVAAGSVITKNIANGKTVLGVPGREIVNKE